jgi:Ni,Fe-hydrogenase maturation factor
MMAKALNVLPKKVIFLGCESEEHEEIGIGVSAAVEAALPVAFKKICDWVNTKETLAIT